ncbi:MAG: hypothetical protein A2Y17_02400 [Clostridiales bacterium GWF2_38_85]|nr:MAG: hypothetical protein A2Y17_02400 [Clostridiales bacterium GWF2_38_85]HBL85048.1 hypothetical protein [Clostridiales bacterium]
MLKINKESILYTVIVLTVISSGIALLLAIINSVTSPVIAKKNLEEKGNAIQSIYTDYISFESTKTEVKNAEELYIVSHGDTTDYCVLVSPSGFGGEIQMMVGVTGDLKISGVEIVSMSETAGVGTKIKNADFLSQFIGLQVNKISTDVDVISGATVSSTAAKVGVETALDAVSEYLKAGDNG